MASYYVWSGATGSANGTSWANAYVTLTLAFSGKAAGDVFYVAHDHSESSASIITLASPGTNVAPTKVVCVNRAGSVPPVSADRRATAQIATTGSTNIQFTGGAIHYDGIIFVAGNAAGTATLALALANGIWNRFDNCSLRLGGTGNGVIQVNGAGSVGGAYVELNNTTMSFSAVGQNVTLTGPIKWRNTPSALIGAAVPTTLFVETLKNGADLECIGVDLSAMGSGKTLVGALATATAVRARFIDCKLDAAVTKSTVPLSHGSTEIDVIRSGSAGNNYTVYRHRISGELMEETTIVRTGGALG